MEAPNKELLEYYVAERGVEGAMALFHLTEKQFDKMFYPQATGESDRFTWTEPTDYEEWEPVITPDTIELARVIKENYTYLRKYKVTSTTKINTRSLTKEDMFHNALLSILKNGGTFKYKSDEDTLLYIDRATNNKVIDAKRGSILAEQKENEFQYLFAEDVKEDYYDETAVLLEGLSDKEKVVTDYLVKGYTSKEIAEKLNVNISTVYRIKESVANKVMKNIDSGK